MESTKADIKLEVKEEPEYVYVDETICLVKLEENEIDAVAPKHEGERIVAEIGLCDDHQKPLPGSSQRRQILKVQKTDQALVGTRRKILPRPQIQIQSLNFSQTPLPVAQVQVVAHRKAQKPEPKKQQCLTVKSMSPVKSQSGTSMGRKILPRPHFPSNIGQSQPNNTNIQQSISLNKPQSIASGNGCNVVAMRPATVKVSQTLPMQQLSSVTPGHVPTQVNSQATVPEFTSTCASSVQTVHPVKSTKNGCMQPKKSLGPGRKLLPRPQPTTCNQGAFIPSQQLQSVSPLQQVKSINPVSAPQHISSPQFQSINSANIQQSPAALQSLQGLQPVNVQQALPVQQLQNIPSVSSQQALPLQQLPNVPFESSTQSVPIQQLQSIPTVSVHHSVPFQSLQEVVTTNSLESLQSLSSVSAHHALPLQPLPNISSNLMPSLPKLAPANMQRPISIQPVPTAPMPQQLSVQSLQTINPGSAGQDIPVQQMHGVHPCTRSAVPLQGLKNITTITTQAVPVQGQCILADSKQHNIPIQTVHPISTINTLPVQLQSSQQQLPLQQIQPNPNAAPQQAVPTQQLPSNVHCNGKQNLNFQQIQPKQTKLSIQQVCPVTSAGSHQLVQLHHVQSVTPDASHKGIPIQRIKTTSVSKKLMSSQKFQPVAPKLQQSEVLLTPEETATNISSTHHGISLHQLKSVAPDSTTLKLPLPNHTSQVVHKRRYLTRRTKSVCCTKPRRKILPRPILPTASNSTPLHQATALVPTKIMTQEVLKSGTIEKSMTVFVPQVGSAAETIAQNPQILSQLQSASSSLTHDYIPVSQAVTVDDDAAKKLSPSQQVQPSSITHDSCVSYPEQQNLFVNSNVENVVPYQLLKSDGSSSKLLTSSDLKGETVGDSHIALALEVNEKANIDFLESLERSQEVYGKMNSTVLPTKNTFDLVSPSPNLVGSSGGQTTHVSVQTFRDLCEDSSMSTEDVTGLQGNSCASLKSVDTSALEHKEETVQDGWSDPNLEENTIGLYQLEYSSSKDIKEMDFTSHVRGPSVDSTSPPERGSDQSQTSDTIYQQEESISSKNEEGTEETQLLSVSKFTGVDVDDPLQEVSYLIVEESTPCAPLQYSEDASTKDSILANEAQSTSNISNESELLIHYQPVATSCEETGQQALVNVVHDNKVVHQESQGCGTTSNFLFHEMSSSATSGGKQNAEVVPGLSEESDSVRKGDISLVEYQLDNPQLNKDQVEPLENHQQTEEEGREQARAAEGQRTLKRKWTLSCNGHVLKRGKSTSSVSRVWARDYYRRNFRSFHSFQLQKRRVLEMSCLKRKIMSQEMRIRSLEEELQEERKKNEVLRRKLLKKVSGRKAEVAIRTNHSLGAGKCPPRAQESAEGTAQRKIQESRNGLSTHHKLEDLRERNKNTGVEDGVNGSLQSEELVKLIREFMMQDDVSQQCNERGGGPGETGPLRSRLHFLRVLHKRFLADCCRACSFETFAKNIPENVIKLKADEVNVCVCTTCQNPELKVESMVKRRLLDIDTSVEEILSSDEAWDAFMKTLGTLKARQALLTYKFWSPTNCRTEHKEKRTATRSLAEVTDMLESELHALKAHLNRTCQRYEEVFKAKCEAMTSPHHAVVQSGWSPLILFQPVGGSGSPAEPQGVVNMQCGRLWSQGESTGFAALSDSRARSAPAVCAGLEKVLERIVQKGITSLTFVTDPETRVSCLREYTRRHEIESKWVFLEADHGLSAAEKAVGERSVTELLCESIDAGSVRGLRNARDVVDLLSGRSGGLVHLYGDCDIQRQKELISCDTNVSLEEDGETPVE